MAFKWNKKKERAALLLAQNDMNQIRIAEEVGTTDVTISNWKREAEFMARVASHMDEIEQEMLRLPIAKRVVRLRRLNDLQERLQLVLDDRQNAYKNDEGIVGGRSGVITKQTKSVGYGKNTEIIQEAAFDASIVREMRAIDEQAAKELGQWIDKGELTGANGSPLMMSEVVINMAGLGDAPIDDPDDPED